MLNRRHPWFGSVRWRSSRRPDGGVGVAAGLSSPVFRLGGKVLHGERQMVVPWSSLAPCRGVSQESGLLGVGLRPLKLVGCVSRGSGSFSWLFRAGHSSSMIYRTCMGGGIVWLLSRTPGGSNISSLFLEREGVSGLSRARAMGDLLCLSPRLLLAYAAGERRSAAVIRQKGSF